MYGFESIINHRFYHKIGVMLIALLVWIICFFTIFFLGFFITQALAQKNIYLSIDTIFFTGFVGLSLLTSYLSIFSPLNYVVLFIIMCLELLIAIIVRKQLWSYTELSLKNLKNISALEKLILLFLILLIALYSSYQIMVVDTGSYHAQSIQWIQSFSVVPGLSNLHSRFGFNSMFFPVCSLFTINTSQYAALPTFIIYPINSLCLIILLLKTFFSIRESYRNQHWRTALFGVFIIGLCMQYLLPIANSPSPDVILSILVIYVFQTIIKQTWNTSQYQLLLIITIVFLCITIKLSAICLTVIILPFLKYPKKIKKLGYISLIGLIVTLPFFIRNYYLSGYIVYPLPTLDFFTVDWKIPSEIALQEQLWIKSWARIPSKLPQEVLSLTLNQWIYEWWARKDIVMKFILICNILACFSSFYFLIKQQYKKSMVYITLFINLIFWFTQAPDPRFVYGFLFVGCALFIADCITLFKKMSILNRHTFLIIAITTNLGVLYLQRGMIGRMVNTSKIWFQPPAPTIVQTITHQTNFVYYSPKKNGKGCHNTTIPCTSYPNKKLILRKNSLQEGFRIKR